MDAGQEQRRRAGRGVARRGVLAGVAAIVAGWLAKASERVAQAADGGNLIIGQTNTSTNTTYLNRNGSTLSTGTNVGLIVNNDGASDGIRGATSGNNNYGVWGINYSSGGIGVRGVGDTGVFGDSGSGIGVSGFSTSQVGVLGTSPNGQGVVGNAAQSAGVRGNSGGISGMPAAGVLGCSDPGPSGGSSFAVPSQPAGVYGLSNSSIPGVIGQSNSGNGVYGAASANVGVLGTSTTSHGLYGASTNGYGLYATSTSSTGIVASTNGGNAIQGASNSNVGVLGTSNSSIGGYFSSGTSTGLYATGPGAGFAARFDGPVQVNGAFTVLGGPKSAAVPHPDGSYRRLYCTEAPESWFEDFGRAQLVNGQARVPLDADFAALVHADSYQVFAFPEGDCNGLYVSGRTAAGFEVRELKGGTSTLPFSYRLVAKRKDLAGPRLEKVEVAAVPPRPAAPQPPPPILRLEPPVSDPNARPPQRQP
ncbi:MAG TPA: hypothetical protein VK066_05670 [Chloroflexota bacterium]|nr:hypothetical protein [Chloroflexota bacterium]